MSKRGGRVRTWRRRFFVLKGMYLWYCKEEEDLQVGELRVRMFQLGQ